MRPLGLLQKAKKKKKKRVKYKNKHVRRKIKINQRVRDELSKDKQNRY